MHGSLCSLLSMRLKFPNPSLPLAYWFGFAFYFSALAKMTQTLLSFIETYQRNVTSEISVALIFKNVPQSFFSVWIVVVFVLTFLIL